MVRPAVMKDGPGRMVKMAVRVGTFGHCAEKEAITRVALPY